MNFHDDIPFEFEPVTDPPFNTNDIAMDEKFGEAGLLRFTVFRAHGARLSKEYKLEADGSIDDDGGTQLYYGDYEVVEFDAAAGIRCALAAIGPLFEGLRPFEAVVLGVPKDGSVRGTITVKGRKDIDTEALTRTLEDFGWPDGIGLLFCDGDNIDGLFALLCGVYPPFKDLAALVRPSASASVKNPATGEKFKRGEHLYVAIDEPALSKDCLKALLRLAWVHGLGWPMLGKDGHAHVRGPVDVTVGSPERLAYEGAAVVCKGLERLPRLASVIGSSGILCAKDLLAYADQHAPEAEVNALVEAAKAEPEFVARQTVLKRAHKRDYVRKEVAKGKSPKKAVQEYNRTFGATAAYEKRGNWTFRELPSGHTLYLKDETSFTIADIQYEPWKYNGLECADPIEGLDYASKAPAIIYINNGRIEIYSLAHGGAFAYFAPLDLSQTTFGESFRNAIARGAGQGGTFFSKPGTTGQGSGSAKPSPPGSLPWLDMSSWDTDPVPERQWAIKDRVPLNQVGIFSGEGGTGKSIIELMKDVAHVAGLEWYGMQPAQGPAFYLGAEDEEDELHIRLAVIAKHFGVTFKQLIEGGLKVLPLLGKDSMLCVPSKSGRIKTTALYDQIFEAAGDLKPKNISVDTLSRAFGGSEIDRVQVYAFAMHMQALAKVAGGSVTILSHPSLAGMASGSGISGSTAWHGAFRFRQYLKGVKEEAGEQPDDDLRELEFKKNQYGPRGSSLVLRYQHGLFLPENGLSDLEQAARTKGVEHVFMELLRQSTAQGDSVSHKKTSRNYAPTAFAEDPHATGLKYRKKDFEEAMNRLLATGKIKIEAYGPPSRRFSKLVMRSPMGSGTE